MKHLNQEETTRNNAGGRRGRQTSIYMDRATEDYLRQLGHKNLSTAVRVVVQDHKNYAERERLISKPTLLKPSQIQKRGPREW